MLTNLRKKTLFFVILASLSATACQTGYNDNPSQQITKATVGCLVANDFYAVYFSTYIKPTETNLDKDKKKLFKSYCKDIPTPGMAFFTADLVDRDVRTMPIAISIVEQELTGSDDSKAENFKTIRTIAEIPAKQYSRGVVEAQAELPKEGYYALYLTIGEEAFSDEDKLRIPLHVGVDPDAMPMWKRAGIGVAVTLGFALIGFVAFRFMRRQLP
jgi:hypothetical protein